MAVDRVHTVRRQTFIAGTAGLFASGIPSHFANAATPAPTSHSPVPTPTPAGHKHGTNGIRIPTDKHINISMRVLDGPDWQLQANRGKVVFMNFFATWCPACIDESPAFVEYALRANDDVTIVGVDYGENDDVVRGWRKKYHVPYPICMDPRAILSTNLNIGAFPTTLIFRPDGRISCAVIGTMDADDFDGERAYALDTERDVPTTPSPLPTR